MNRIEIRGVIVPSEYDNSWYQGYIDKGVITPESRVRNAIAGYDKKKPMDLYVNSPGGSVFAAYEIINTLKAWALDAKQAVTITVGAMAASAAGAISILSGAKLRVHKNSKLMFHGAWTETVGGAGAHKDTETLLSQINADIKTKLVSAFNIPVEVVDEWFSEGRAGWITAQDALKYGMASEIIDAEDAPVEFLPADVSNIGAHGLDIAAFASDLSGETPVIVKDEDKKDESEAEKKGDENDGGKSADETTDGGGDAKDGDNAGDGKTADEPAATEQAKVEPPDNEAIIAAEVSRRVELEHGSRLAEYVNQLTECKTRIESLDKAAKSLQSAKDKAESDHAKQVKQFEAQLAESQEALKQANARLTKLTIGSLSFSPSIESWEDAMKACGGDYAKAAQQYPDVLDQYRKNHNKGKKS